MPRRTVTKCSRRHAGEKLDVLHERNLTHGEVWGVRAWQFTTRAEFAAAWGRWGDVILPRWIEHCPGSRPAAMYVLGLIRPPKWIHELPGLRRPFRQIEGATVRIPDLGWHRFVPELENLYHLGIVGDDEYELAVERLDGPQPLDFREYRLVSDDE
jgi:hypothetical protein